jgi:hypothetical protein
MGLPTGLMEELLKIEGLKPRHALEAVNAAVGFGVMRTGWDTVSLQPPTLVTIKTTSTVSGWLKVTEGEEEAENAGVPPGNVHWYEIIESPGTTLERSLIGKGEPTHAWSPENWATGNGFTTMEVVTVSAHPPAAVAIRVMDEVVGAENVTLGSNWFDEEGVPFVMVHW